MTLLGDNLKSIKRSQHFIGWSKFTDSKCSRLTGGMSGKETQEHDQLIRKILSNQIQELVPDIELQLQSRGLQHLDPDVRPIPFSSIFMIPVFPQTSSLPTSLQLVVKFSNWEVGCYLQNESNSHVLTNPLFID